MGRAAIRNKAASIKDVAALAQVSVPTVSRYLNDRDRVSEEKQERIAKAIDLLDYRPNRIAQALVRDRTTSVTVLATNTTLYGQSETLHGVELRAHEAGYSLNVAMLSGESQKDLRASVQSSLDQNPAGVILLNYDDVSDAAYPFLPPELPIVVIAGERRPEVAQISLQENISGYNITKYLLSLGHATVFHVTIPGGKGAYSRMNGWRQALSEAGVYAPTVRAAQWDPQSGRVIGQQLGKDSSVTAIFAGNDEIAMGIIRGLNDVGRRVPDDVSVVGFDDHPISQIWNPSLTTIRQDFRKAGRLAFDMLKDKIDDVIAGRGHTDNWAKYVELPGELLIRESTAAAA